MSTSKAREHLLALVVGAALFVAGVWVLVKQVGGLGPAHVLSAFREARPETLWLTLALVTVYYFVLTFYDQLAVTYVKRRLPRWRVAIASFVGFAISNTVGFGVVSGATARYRFYGRWNVNAGDISRIVAFYSASIWLGLLVMGGVSLAVDPPNALVSRVPSDVCRGVGAMLIAAAAGYVVACATRRQPIRIGRFEIPLPSVGMSIAQIVVSTLDWMLAAAILYLLLPSPRPSYFAVAGAFSAAQLVGLASHVPGSVGVFEGLIVLFLSDVVDPVLLIQSLLLFRVCYYLVPLAVALVVLFVHEARRRHPLDPTGLKPRRAGGP